jgi:hypothetical protein
MSGKGRYLGRKDGEWREKNLVGGFVNKGAYLLQVSGMLFTV